MAAATSSNILAYVLRSLSSVKTSEAQSTNDIAQPSSLLSMLNEEHCVIAKNALLTLHFLFPHELLPALDLLDRRLVKRVKFCQTLQDDWATFAQRPFTDGDFTRCPPVDLHEVQQESKTLKVSQIHQKCMTATDLEVFYIQSASANQGFRSSTRGQVSGRFKNAWQGNATNMYYEVRLDSWNCTCAAFAQSQLKVLLQEPTSAYVRPLSGLAFNENVDVDIRASGPEANDMEESKQEHEYSFIFGGSLIKHEMPVPICKHILAAAIATAAPDIFARDTENLAAGLTEFSGWAAGWGEF